MSQWQFKTVLLGRGIVDTGPAFVGAIADVTIYGRALTGGAPHRPPDEQPTRHLQPHCLSATH